MWFSSPLSAETLANNIGVKVWSAADVSDLTPNDLHQLTVVDPDSWSACTLRIRDRHLIVFNPAQSAPRVNSVLMHELSHIMLGHDLALAGVTSDGHLIPSNYKQDQEDEADWLGGTLLLPRPSLMAIRRSKLADEEAMHKYRVSGKMPNWRFRMTGVDYQIANAQRSRRSA